MAKGKTRSHPGHASHYKTLHMEGPSDTYLSEKVTHQSALQTDETSRRLKLVHEDVSPEETCYNEVLLLALVGKIPPRHCFLFDLHVHLDGTEFLLSQPGIRGTGEPLYIHGALVDRS